MSDDDLLEEPEKRSALGRVLGSLLIMALLGIAIAGGALFYANGVYTAKGPLTATKIVTIKRGTGTSNIAQLLTEQGVISNPGLFTAATYALRSSRGSLKAGEFEFPAGATMAEVLRLLQAGKSLAYKVTIPEGWTTQKALERVVANKVLKGELTSRPKEGAILPDTYVFQRGTTRDALVKRMTDAQTKLLDEIWDKRQKGLPIKSKAEAVTLASIVERETGIGLERAKVAAVFVNRLNKKMRLQSDPTIIYGIVGGKGKMDRPISKKDIAKKTAYNTYQIDGLPPTPIANPGREAIKAVLNPSDSDALFFVADGTGGHAFAKTLKGHQANVANWRKIERARKKTSAKAQKQAKKKVAPATTTSTKSTKSTKSVTSNENATTAKTKSGKSIPLPPVKPAQN